MIIPLNIMRVFCLRLLFNRFVRRGLDLFINKINLLSSKQKAMAEIIRNRTIRPSTRLEKSKNYKIDTKKVSQGDILTVNINHETKPFSKTYSFNGADVAHKNSIHFRVNDFGTSIDILWSGSTPT